jgi:hypothetical protein
MRYATALLLLLAATAQSQGSIEVTTDIFDSKVIGDDTVWLIFFTRGTSNVYRKTWTTINEKLKRINCGIVDVDTHDGRQLATKLMADGKGKPMVPALQLFTFTDSPDSISIFDGTTALDLKQTQKRLKRRLKIFDKNKEGKFMKKPLYAEGVWDQLPTDTFYFENIVKGHSRHKSKYIASGSASSVMDFYLKNEVTYTEGKKFSRSGNRKYPNIPTDVHPPDIPSDNRYVRWCGR